MPNLPSVDPRTLPGLFAWYNANYVNGFGAANPAADAAVAQWNDLGPNAKHLVQGTGANQPLFRATGGPNNFPSVNFVDATDTMTIATAGAIARPITVIALLKNTLADDAAYHKAATFNAARIGVGLDWATANAFAPFDDAAAQAGGTVAGDITTYHVESFVAAPLNASSRGSVDGVHVFTAGIAGTNTNADVTVGGASWIGHLCEVMIFTGDLGFSVMYTLEQAVMSSWGLYPSYLQQR
jgi:hypothetical protein